MNTSYGFFGLRAAKHIESRARMPRLSRALAALAAVLLLAPGASPSSAQDARGADRRAYALKGARVLAAPGKAIDGGVVVVRGGVIESVGPAGPPFPPTPRSSTSRAASSTPPSSTPTSPPTVWPESPGASPGTTATAPRQAGRRAHDGTVGASRLGGSRRGARPRRADGEGRRRRRVPSNGLRRRRRGARGGSPPRSRRDRDPVGPAGRGARPRLLRRPVRLAPSHGGRRRGGRVPGLDDGHGRRGAAGVPRRELGPGRGGRLCGAPRGPDAPARLRGERRAARGRRGPRDRRLRGGRRARAPARRRDRRRDEAEGALRRRRRRLPPARRGRRRAARPGPPRRLSPSRPARPRRGVAGRSPHTAARLRPRRLEPEVDARLRTSSSR